MRPTPAPRRNFAVRHLKTEKPQKPLTKRARACKIIGMEKIISSYNTEKDVLHFHHTRAGVGHKPTAGYFERHTQFEILYLIEGELSLTVEEETYRVNSGDIILINADEIHKLSVSEKKPYERIVFMFDLSALGECFPVQVNVFNYLLLNDYRIQRVLPAAPAEKYRLTEMLKTIVSAPQDDMFFYDTLLARTLLLAANLTKVLEDKESGIKPVATNEFMKKAVTYINMHLTEELSLESLSKALFVSKSYLSHVFRERMNISVNNYIITKKIHYAHKLITGGMSPAEACLKTGYNYYTTFFYNYKSIMGKTPSSSVRKKPQR